MELTSCHYDGQYTDYVIYSGAVLCVKVFALMEVDLAQHIVTWA